MYEEFYRAVERMYDKALDFLLTMDDQTIAEYRPRFEYMVTSTCNIGWYFHDTLVELFDSAFPDEELDEEDSERA